MKLIDVSKRNQKGVALIWTYLTSIFLLTMLTGFYTLTSFDTKYAAVDAERTQAFYLAEAGTDKMLNQIRVGNTADIPLTNLDAVGKYQASYDPATSVITASGKSGDSTKIVQVKISGGSQKIPPGVFAALTTKNLYKLNADKGSITIDGRNYDINGNLLADPTGMAGIAYGEEAAPKYKKDVKVGGPTEAPSTPTSLVEKQLTDTEAGDAQSIENVLGLEDASVLDAYKNSAVPANPLNNEVYYYNGLAKNTIDLNGGSGILIVNPSNKDKATLTGKFTGLVIVDAKKTRLDNITIIGALVITNGDTDSGDDNDKIKEVDEGNSKILFSEDALMQLPEIEGASYAESGYAVGGWIDNSNGQNRL